MNESGPHGKHDPGEGTPVAVLSRIARVFATKRFGDAFASLHEEFVRLGIRALTIAAVDERSSDPLRYEFAADAARRTPEPLDPHTLAFALAADKPRILTTSANGAKSYLLACPIRVAGVSRGFMVVQSDAQYSNDVIEIVEAAAVMTGQQIALLRRETGESMKDRALGLMLEAARVLSAADPDDLFATVHQLVGRVMDAPIFVGSLVVPESDDFFAVYYADYGKVSKVRALVPERSPTAQARRTGKAISIYRPTD